MKKKNKKHLKIKQTRSNIFYLIMGRITTYILLYAVFIGVLIGLFDFIISNCITTLK